MKLIGTVDDIFLIPKDNVRPGDIVVRLYKRYCRRVKRTERQFFFVAMKRQGKLMRVHMIRSDEVYEAKVAYPKKPIFISKGSSIN